jgi:ribonuclease T1
MLRNVLGPVAARFGAAGLLAVSLWAGSAWVLAKAPAPLVQDSTVALAQLPAQGQKTYELIAQGGPFPYDKDGTVFGNRERILPAQKRGFYREYTVKTPYERSRGAKRIVCGGEKPSAPEACYYTDDHYASFRKIVK